jgi:hypothetical protein
VLEVPLALDLLDAQLGVLPDPLSPLVRAEARVVVDRVVREMRGDEVGVAGVERLVVGADVVEVADRTRFIAGLVDSDRRRSSSD